ncbi:MAG TPA: hypothetical protein VK489_02005 [Ferruginibacter sp.]|nr:hypothetical protein [Ferruginibacter sp.]
MKKSLLLFFLSIIINCHNFVNAQSLSIEETKKVLTSNKWLITRTEEDGERAEVEKEMQGQKWVFKTDGTVYFYLPSEKESDAPRGKWTITKTHIIADIGDDRDEVRFLYRLEKASVYYLYLESTDDEGYTAVFKQAEKIDSRAEASVSPAFKNSFDYFSGAGFDEQWHFSYTKGEKMSTQRWKVRKSFPATEILAEWKEDFYITDLIYKDRYDGKEWLLVTAKNKYTNQLYIKNSHADSLRSTVETGNNTYPGYAITHIAYGDSKWYTVYSKGTGYTYQKLLMRREFPEEIIKENWAKDYHITDMVYGGGWWTIILSKGSTITKQHYHIWNSWEQSKIDEESSGGKYLTETVKQGDKWYMIFSEDKDIYAQDTEVDRAIPEKKIRTKWDNGYFISRAFFY